MLDKILEAAKARIERDKQTGLPPKSVKQRAPFRFEESLRQPGVSFICEIKKASPSKGVTNSCE